MAVMTLGLSARTEKHPGSGQDHDGREAEEQEVLLDAAVQCRPGDGGDESKDPECDASAPVDVP
jgi:hypothetical protein